MNKSDNKGRKTEVVTDNKKGTTKVARDDGLEGPKTQTATPIKPSVDPAQTKKT